MNREKSKAEIKECWCIANVNGICKVENCRGEIRQLPISKNKNPYTAAKYYNFTISSFEDYFSEDYEDADDSE